MIRIFCYCLKAIEKLQINIVDPNNNGNYILLVIPAEDISDNRKFRVKDLDFKQIITTNNNGSKTLRKKYYKIFQNYASFMNLNR